MCTPSCWRNGAGELRRRRTVPSGTKAAERIVKIISVCSDIPSELQRRRRAPSATRTRDLLLRRQLLYPLSYRGQPGQGGNLLAGPKPNRSAAITRRPFARRSGVARRRVARVERGREDGRNDPSVSSLKSSPYMRRGS